VKTVTKTFKDGDIIYRQGDDSHWAFEVLEGSVELMKEGPNGPITTARLKAGELFGELGILDNTPRSTSARARGSVTVKAIPRDEFLTQVEADPNTALKVMTKLARRMRSPESGDPIRAAAYKAAVANLPVPVQSEPLAAPAPVRLGRPLPTNLIGERKPNFMEKIFDAMVKDPTRRPGKPAKNPPPADVFILVGRFRDDYENMQHKAVLQALDGIPGVRAQGIDRDLTKTMPGVTEPGATANDDLMKRAAREARAWMVPHNADLLVWGNIDSTGRNIELHFTATSSSPGERPGRFTAINVLTVPVDFYTDWVPLIRAVVLAAIDPRSFPQGRILRSALPAIAQNARGMGLDPSAAMEPLERASILFCYGNVCAVCAQLEGDRSWYHTAVEAWRAAIELAGPDQGGPLSGQLHQQLGLVLQIIAERSNDTDSLELAADSYRRALIHISRRKQPADWGLMKYRLGCVLYKIDMAIGDDNALREAIHACQASRQVFNRYTHPIRWSEVSNTLAQILQVYGDNARSIPILEYAVKCCVQSLQVRTPDTAPLQWASIQNTLGSALFLLAKHTGEWEYMRQSSEAFRFALSVYKDHGAGRMAVITERNLHRAERQINSTGDAHAQDPVWAQSFNITDDSDSFDWQSFLGGSNDSGVGGQISEVA
jgi:hypothetical protein